MEIGELADAVHGEHRISDVDGLDAAGSFCDGTDGGAAAHVCAINEGLQRDVFFGAEGAQHGFAARRGGVAVAGGELEHGPFAETRTQYGIGFLWIIRMRGVGLVAAEDDALCKQRAQVCVGGFGDARKRSREQRSGGALSRVATDLFVLIADENGDVICRLAVADGAGGCVSVGEIVNARAGVERMLSAEDLRRFRAHKIELVGENIFRHKKIVAGSGELFAQSRRVARSPEGEQLFLWIDRIVAAFHMCRQRRDRHLLRQFDERALWMRPVFATDENASGDGERTVEPCGEDRPAVDFDIEHRESFAQDLWLRLQAQRRRIVVRGDDAKTARRSLRQREGDGGAVVCREKIAPARGERPVGVFVESGDPLRDEHVLALAGSVIRRERSGHV